MIWRNEARAINRDACKYGTVYYIYIVHIYKEREREKRRTEV